MTDERQYEPIYVDRTESHFQRVPEIEAATFSVSEELQKAVEAALTNIGDRSFSARHPELGKMVNCQVCGTRHRKVDATYNRKKKSGLKILGNGKCEQVFTYRVGDYEYFRKDATGELVPDYRTAVNPEARPTQKQVIGRAAFAKKRFHPHPSKIKLLFIERVRKVFETLGFALEQSKDQTKEEFQEQFQKDLQRARVVAARQLRKERRLSSRETRRMQDTSRRINRGG
jgi:hypothetical protein